MGKASISKGADGLLPWRRLDEQLHSMQLDYLAQRNFLTTLETVMQQDKEDIPKKLFGF